MKWAQEELAEYDSEFGIRQSYIQFLSREKLRFLVFLRSTGQFVAATSLHSIDWDVRRFEIGYWIDTRFSGNGYMTEAVQGLCDFAFSVLHARRLEIRCDTRNSSSIKIPRRLQFELEGILRADDVSADGQELRDTYVFSKLWDELRDR